MRLTVLTGIIMREMMIMRLVARSRASTFAPKKESMTVWRLCRPRNLSVMSRSSMALITPVTVLRS